VYETEDSIPFDILLQLNGKGIVVAAAAVFDLNDSLEPRVDAIGQSICRRGKAADLIPARVVDANVTGTPSGPMFRSREVVI